MSDIMTYNELQDKADEVLHQLKTEKEESMPADNNKDQDWYVEVNVLVCGPKEKPVRGAIQYLGTSKEVALGIQNQLMEMGVKFNTQGIPAANNPSS